MTATVTTETRARRRIRAAVESRGYALVSLEWEPWEDQGEKSGIGGGWYGQLDRSYRANTWPGNDIMGLSVDETIAWVDQFVDPPEQCECPNRDGYPLNARAPGGCHEQSCRWHLRYWLRWWGPKP